jgi:2-polyprenyl-3-methyl-5-hydroxy-6-metoxy-1,4-benzoquinol methylase
MAPIAPELAALVNRLLGRRTAAAKWNAQYAEGRWTAFDRLDELAHYSVLAGYALHLKPGGALLDVGCGDGTLRERLHHAAFSRYVGVDFAEAVERARHRADDKTEFVVGDMREFTPSATFDTIVFNESLYYVSDPIAELARYAGRLAPGGVFLISTHLKSNTEALWAKIAASHDVIDHTTVVNAQGTTWRCGAVQPRRAS